MCEHLKYGYCKFNNHCRRKKTCAGTISGCKEKECHKRHTKVCKICSNQMFCQFGTEYAFVRLVDTILYVRNQLNNKNVKERNNKLKIKFFEDEVKKLQIKQLIDTKKNKTEETIKQNGNESKTLKPNIILKTQV